MNRCILASVLCMLVVAPAMANLVDNGSFETPVVPVNSFTRIAAGSSALSPWSVGGAGIDLKQTGYLPAQDGLNSVDLNAVDSGSVSQDITFLTDGWYELSFYMAGNPGISGTKTMDVTLGSLVDESLSYLDPGVNWTPYSYVFFATAGTQTLTFVSTNGGEAGPTLDNVSIEETVEPVVPLPGAALLAIMGLGTVGMKLRRFV